MTCPMSPDGLVTKLQIFIIIIIICSIIQKLHWIHWMRMLWSPFLEINWSKHNGSLMLCCSCQTALVLAISSINLIPFIAQAIIDSTLYSQFKLLPAAGCACDNCKGFFLASSLAVFRKSGACLTSCIWYYAMPSSCWQSAAAACKSPMH